MIKEKKEYIYKVEYNYCIYENGYYTMSVHKTYKGAYLALKKFLLKKYYIWYNSPKEIKLRTKPIQDCEYYRIQKVELEE